MRNSTFQRPQHFGPRIIGQYNVEAHQWYGGGNLHYFQYDSDGNDVANIFYNNTKPEKKISTIAVKRYRNQNKLFFNLSIVFKEEINQTIADELRSRINKVFRTVNESVETINLEGRKDYSLHFNIEIPFQTKDVAEMIAFINAVEPLKDDLLEHLFKNVSLNDEKEEELKRWFSLLEEELKRLTSLLESGKNLFTEVSRRNIYGCFFRDSSATIKEQPSFPASSVAASSSS